MLRQAKLIVVTYILGIKLLGIKEIDDNENVLAIPKMNFSSMEDL